MADEQDQLDPRLEEAYGALVVDLVKPLRDGANAVWDLARVAEREAIADQLRALSNEDRLSLASAAFMPPRPQTNGEVITRVLQVIAELIDPRFDKITDGRTDG